MMKDADGCALACTGLGTIHVRVRRQANCHSVPCTAYVGLEGVIDWLAFDSAQAEARGWHECSWMHNVASAPKTRRFVSCPCGVVDTIPSPWHPGFSVRCSNHRWLSFHSFITNVSFHWCCSLSLFLCSSLFSISATYSSRLDSASVLA